MIIRSGCRQKCACCIIFHRVIAVCHVVVVLPSRKNARNGQFRFQRSAGGEDESADGQVPLAGHEAFDYGSVGWSGKLNFHIPRKYCTVYKVILT